MEFKINNRYIGSKHPPLIIAEIGINHGGSLEVAKSMVHAAFTSGCECVKHQTHIISDEMTYHAKDIIPAHTSVSIWDIIKNNSLSQDDEIALKHYAESLGMVYLSTPFSREAAKFLNSLDVPAFKIGSGECDNIPLLKEIASYGKPIILSTGMNSLASVEDAVRVLRDAGVPFALLECTNLYPSPPENVSLHGIIELRDSFPDAVIGFSDHSIGPYMAFGALGLGASIIERHFTDNRYRNGPDIVNSMDPVELKLLVERSREIWISLNNPKLRTTEEENIYSFARASVVADCDIKKGEILDETKIWVRRPGNGQLTPKDYYNILGKKVLVDLSKNEQLKWSDIEN